MPEKKQKQEETQKERINHLKCPNCGNKNILKKGIRKNKLQNIQKYCCKACGKFFTAEETKHKTYPIKIILNAISYYNLGYTQKQTSAKIDEKFKINLPQKTISNWLNEYKQICTFSRSRKQAIKHYSPKNIIKKQTLHHIQPYIFKCHNAKLNIAVKENPQFAALKDYIEKINSKQFPHRIFTYHQKNSGKSRASQIKFDYLRIKTRDKNNLANKLAKLALQTITNNKQRHEAVQNFFLTNDSTTIAAEVPVYLTNWDAGYYKNQKGFSFPLSNYTTPITGHIDILQIRNGLIHILDYKPNAKNQSPIEQLTIYALALSRKLNLPLYHFKCAWFDESNYFEFFPLHVVYEKRGKIK